MSIDIRLPYINAGTDHEQMQQLKSYLYQMVEQLNWALNTIETGGVQSSEDTFDQQESTQAASEADAQATFNGIKSLILKSADIVNAYYETMQVKMSGDYVASSDFGRYKSTTDADIAANSSGIEQLYSNVQEVQSEVSNVSDAIINVQANIKTGYLYTDSEGVPVYGLEVGQRNTEGGEETFRKYARFTSDRLSFYDQNDNEVAYISDYKLYITNAEVTGSLNLGNYYIIDTSDGVAFRPA